MATLRRAMAQGGLLSLLVLHLVLQTGAQGKCCSKLLTATRDWSQVLLFYRPMSRQGIADAGLIADVLVCPEHACRLCKPIPQIETSFIIFDLHE